MTMPWLKVQMVLWLENCSVTPISRNIGQSFCAAVAMSTLAHNIQINSTELGESITGMERGLRLTLVDMPTLGS